MRLAYLLNKINHIRFVMEHIWEDLCDGLEISSIQVPQYTYFYISISILHYSQVLIVWGNHFLDPTLKNGCGVGCAHNSDM